VETREVAFWLDSEILPPEFDFRSSPRKQTFATEPPLFRQPHPQKLRIAVWLARMIWTISGVAMASRGRWPGYHL